MKILFGVQGTGNGHLSRARALCEHFSNADAEVDYFFSGRPREKFFDMETFGNFQVKDGLTLVVNNGRVRHLKTVFNGKPLRFLNDVRQLELDSYDVVISDFDPIVAWAGKLRKKPVINIGHQPAFHYPIPRGESSLASELLLKHFAPSTVHLGLHWHHFGCPILPPIVPAGLTAGQIEKNKILVYLPFDDLEQVSRMLNAFPGYEFYVYSPEHDRDLDYRNFHQRKVSLHGFQQDLLTADGVICNAGFETPSECLQLGKKILVKPLQKQMEQKANAIALQQLGFGDSMNDFDPGVMERWLLSKNSGQKVSYPDVAEAIVKWILNGDWRQSDVKNLSEQLWSKTVFTGSIGTSAAFSMAA